MSNKSNRNRARAETEAQDNTDVEETTLPCRTEDPVLTDLEVASGALHRQGDRWWTTVSATVLVIVRATTRPHNSGAWRAITWSGDGVDCSTRDLKGLSRQTVTTMNAPLVVGAILNSAPMQQRVDVWDLVQLDCDLPIHVGGTTWKGYVGFIPGNRATITATTNPNHADVWAKLRWTPDGAPGNPNQRGYAATAAGDQVVQVVLGTPFTGEISKQATLHICQWPRLQIKWEEFNSLQVLNDGATQIDQPFDKRWEDGRPGAKAGMLLVSPKTTLQVQSPLCWAAGASIGVRAGFRITRKSTDTETVPIEGRATIDGVAMTWTATVQVLATANVGDEVSFAEVTASHPLPASKVQCSDTFQISWFLKDADAATWVACGQTEHLLYVTLAAPTKELYWTLLDISCRGANGRTSQNAVVDAAFDPFKAQIGDAAGFRRLGDNKKMRYYGEGGKTAQGAAVQTPRGILSNATGTGRCGGWSRLMAHMLALHGIDVLVYTMDCSALPANTILHVRNFQHNGAGTCTVSPYTHRGSECTKPDGLAGQGKTNPQFLFGDHAAVYYNNQIYDPSYGVGPEADPARYERNAVAGLGWLGASGGDATTFTMSDGTFQFKADSCCAGFFVDAMPAVGTLDTVAATFGKTGAALWDHPYNRATKALAVNPPPAGTTLYIPRDWAPNRLMLRHGTMPP